MSRIWTVIHVWKKDCDYPITDSDVPNMDRKSYFSPEYKQFRLSIFETSTLDVGNMDSFARPYSQHRPYSGHLVMSEIWTRRARVLDPIIFPSVKLNYRPLY